jgi:hypothetical protein
MLQDSLALAWHETLQLMFSTAWQLVLHSVLHDVLADVSLQLYEHCP